MTGGWGALQTLHHPSQPRRLPNHLVLGFNVYVTYYPRVWYLACGVVYGYVSGLAFNFPRSMVVSWGIGLLEVRRVRTHKDMLLLR